MERTRKPTRGAGAWAAIGAGDITKPGGDVFALTQGMGPAKPDDVAAFDRTIRDWLEDHHTRGFGTGFEVEDFPGSKQKELRAGRESRIINTDTWPYLTKVREFFAKHESKKPEYTEGPEGTMNEAKAIEAFAAKKGLSVAELEEAA